MTLMLTTRRSKRYALKTRKNQKSDKKITDLLPYGGGNITTGVAAYAATGSSFFGGVGSAVENKTVATSSNSAAASSTGASTTTAEEQRRERLLAKARKMPIRKTPTPAGRSPAPSKRRRSAAGPTPFGVDEDALSRAAKQRAQLVMPTAKALIKELERESRRTALVRCSSQSARPILSPRLERTFAWACRTPSFMPLRARAPG